MSGGVDSSVAAHLLKEQGYDVIGVTMQIWQDEDRAIQEENGGCCGLSAVDDARRVAGQLEIPYYVMNFKKEFKKEVIDYFIEEYRQGRTPNPCIACNRYVKWESLLKRSMDIGADYIATGHYARIVKLENGRYTLKRSATLAKDQTYALYNLTQNQLSHTLMPVGEYTKDEIRQIAEKIHLQVANKPDSQDICFVPDGDYASFIEQYTGQSSEPGDFVDKEGKVLGKHKGQIHYTIGQRRGLGISAPESLYVCGKSLDSNEVILGSKQDLMSNYCYINDINLIPWDYLDAPIKCKVKTRYRQPEQPATVEQIGEDLIKITFDEPQRAVTPGQAAVLYDDDMVLGGGTILPESLASTMTTSQGTNI